ncbi:GAF and ANTAR domain-containing protein [Phytoactinopolyspora mesophila]|nr:GAF and ANTAR domain-containing protein [Phytoactinopolyspora mesophila]
MGSPDASEFADAARDLNDEPRLDHTIEKVVEYATRMTDAEAGGLVLLRSQRQLEVAAATGAEVEEAEALQDSLREGPSVSAAREQSTCLVRNTADDTRWPTWGPKVAELGLHSAISACLYTGRRTIGTIDIYAPQAGQLDEDDAARAQVLASHAAIALDCRHEEDGLRQAVETRNVIGQAQGLLMERYGLDARRAFDVLRRYSQDANVKLRDVAEQLVASGNLPDEKKPSEPPRS